MTKIDWNIVYKKTKEELDLVEEKKFNEWKSSTPGADLFFDKAQRNIKKIESRDVSILDEQKAYNDVICKYNKAKKSKVIRNLLYYAAASVIVAITGIFIYKFNNNDFGGERLSHISKEIISHGSPKATLILNDGKVIELDSLKSKELSGEKINIDIQGKGKTITYNKSGNEETASLNKESKAYNEIRIPVGGEWLLTLSDGTVVKLNSKSKLKYPVKFDGDKREVFLEGEGYFNVTKSDKPFIVNTKKLDVKVYGTQFNVMAYKDESIVQTTLVEGKVGLSLKNNNSESKEYILKPNEMAGYNTLEEKLSIRKVDVKNYISWIDGMFVFNDIDFDSLMRKLARWYDFEVFYMNQEVKDYRFSGCFVRYSSFNEILKIISESSYVKYRIKGKTVIIESTK